MTEKSISKGFALLSVSNILAKALSLIYIPFLLRIIHENGYGIYFASYNVYVFFYIITTSGLAIAIPKMISENTANGMYLDAQYIFKIGKFMMTGYGLIMSIILLLLSYPMSIFINYKESFLPILFLSPAILFTAVGCAYRGYFQGVGNMTPLAVSQIIEQIANTIFTLLFAYILAKKSMTLGCAGGTIGTVIGAFLSMIYLQKRYSRECPMPNNGERRYSNNRIFKNIIHYSIPIIISSGILYAGNNIIDVSNISNRLANAGFSYFDRTVYYACYAKYIQLLNVPFILISSLAVAILPLVTKYYALRDFKQLSKKIRYIFKLCFLISIPACIGLSVLSKPIFILIFGNSYSNGSRLMMFGAVTVIFMSISQLQTTILQSVGKVYICTVSLILGVFIKIVCNYMLISNPKINIYGAVIGTCLCYLIPSILNNIILKKYLKNSVHLLNTWTKPLISSIAMGIIVFIVYKILYTILKLFLIVYISNLIAVVISIYLGIITYTITLIGFRAIDENDIKLIPKKLRKILIPII